MTQPHAERAHARLSPSAFERIIRCPGSVRLSEGLPDQTSTYAAEGTAAHELAAYCLGIGQDAITCLGRVIDTKTGTFTCLDFDGETRFEVTEEMVEAVQVYLDAVRTVQGILTIEERLDLGHIQPGMFGTADAIVLDGRTLHVFDLKYGRGKAVEVEENPQLICYAAGAAHRYHNRGVDEVRLVIVQPRASHPKGPVRSYELDFVDLAIWLGELRAAAERANEEDAPLAPGDWCRWCKAAPMCPALRQKSLSSAQDEFGDFMEPTLLTPDQMAEVLSEVETFKIWLKSVEKYAHDQAMSGRPPTGYKLVAKRATRRWKSGDTVEEILGGVRTSPDCFTEPVLKSPAQVEKAVGKEFYANNLRHCVEAKSSGAILAPESDPRPPFKPSAEEEFS